MRNCTCYYEPPLFEWWEVAGLVIIVALGPLVGVTGLIGIGLLIGAVYLLLRAVREMVSRLGGVGLFYGVACTAGMVAWVYYGITYC